MTGCVTANAAVTEWRLWRVAAACALVLALGIGAGCSGGGGVGGGTGGNSGDLQGTDTVPDDRNTGPDGTGSVGHITIPPRPPAQDQTYY